VISFRYHLVSLICVFLGIALGIVIGTSALNGAVVGDLRRQNTDLKQSVAASSTQNKALQAQGTAADQLAQAFGPKISAKTLTGKKIVVIGLPGVSKAMKANVGNQIAAAGGTVSASIQLAKTFADPAHGNDIQSLVSSAHPIGLQIPQTTDTGIQAGSILGYVLLGHGSATDVTQVITGFTALNLLSVDGSTPNPGNAALLLAPGGLPNGDEGGSMLLSFATQLGSTYGATVVAGDSASATQHGLVDLVRGSASAQKAISTVDDVDTPLGQLTTALTLADRLADHRGNFGTAPDADALLPGLSS